ncbi:very short patch repair endonuclease [Ventosimonas gracilis]|uniref:Very short patch repair endonuclease n=1 Tax=Ventosimonas gracilis TaxID=1680762 RepID=A0A139SV65_9GAMM|nr:very short patch repair endonuclease [Ventosimonas gracilis]KXU38322.1 very short patch repair endonuclease [Ventosimonas gracilis]
MTDVVASATRSRMMSGIRARNTRPEMQVRQILHRMGFRFRLHVRKLPGTPDIVLPRWRAAIFVHGCFWHGHDCPDFRLPKTRTDFWQDKISRNRHNDNNARQALRATGWRVGIVWECALRGVNRNGDKLASQLERWLHSKTAEVEIRG